MSLLDTVWPEGIDEAAIMTATPMLGAELDAYVTEQYGENAVVAGHLAVDAEGHILDMRVYIHAVRGEQPVTPHGDGRAADDDRRAWLADTPGATRSMTFCRRPHNVPWTPRPHSVDEHVFDVTRSHAENEDNYEYIGHIITNGTHHGMMVNEVIDISDPANREKVLETLSAQFDRMPDALKAIIVEKSGQGLLNMMPDALTEDVQMALDAAQRFYKNGEKPSDEELDAVDNALRQLEARLAEMDAAEANGTKRKNPMDVPDINPRPNVPPAFYN